MPNTCPSLAAEAFGQCARTTAAQPPIAGPRGMSEYAGNGPVTPVVGAEPGQSGGRLGTGRLQDRPHYLAERHRGVDRAVCDRPQQRFGFLKVGQEPAGLFD